MNHDEIVTRLCLIHPSEVIYEITMEAVDAAVNATGMNWGQTQMK